jgi:putative ABC transport system permease protein
VKYFPLIWAGLWRKPVRTILTVLSITVAFVLFGVLASFGAGYARFMDAQRLDRLMVDPRFTAPLPASYVERIQKLDGVTLVAPVTYLPGYYQDPKNGILVIASDARWFAARPEYNATPENISALASLRTGVIVTRQLASKYNFKVGDKVPLRSRLAQKNGSTTWTFDVVAIMDGLPGDAIGFMIGNYAYFDEARANETGTFRRLILRIRDPKNADVTSSLIDKLLANSSAPTRTISERAAETAFARQGVDIEFFVQTVIGATLFMLLFVTANVMKQSVHERIPEFAVLKTIGYSGKIILGLVLAESMIQSVVGAILGLGLAKIAFIMTADILKRTVPVANLPVASVITDQVSLAVVVMATGVTVAVAVASGLLPALRAQRITIVDALAGR